MSDQRGGICGEACEKDTQITDDLATALQGQDVTGAWGDEFGRATVIEDDGGEAQGHGFKNHAAAEFPDAGKHEDIALAEAGLKLGVVDPAFELGAAVNLLAVDESLKAGTLGAIADEIEVDLALFDQGSGGFDEHVNAFESDQSADESDPKRAWKASGFGFKCEA